MKRRRGVWWLAAVAVAALTGLALGWPGTLFKALASKSLREREPAQALDWLAWARRFQSPDGELEFLSARAARQKGQMNQLREHVERAWKLGYPTAILEREQILGLAQSGQMPEAEPALAGFLVDPQDDVAEICEAFATGFLKNYRRNDALRLLEAWVGDQPNNARARLFRAKLDIEIQQWSGAADHLEQVLQARPAQTEATYLLAGVLLQQKLPERALILLARAEKDSRFRTSSRVQRVAALRMLTRYEEAQKLASSLLEQHADEPNVLFEVGKLESDVGNYTRAIEHLDRARQVDPNSSEVRYALGVALRGAGRGDEARPHFQFVTQARERLAQALRRQDDVAKDPENVEARCEIGAIYLDYGQPEKGILWLNSALQYNPQCQTAHQCLARYYESRSHESNEMAALARKHFALASENE
ncbi:MAG TPA: tetratricopeptide repeat protein [Planctomycetaceae bacterium]|jgi:predicted Zn-dependent protease